MPPLEDELRTALHGRAATLAPLADPVPGVERRVRGLRRRRAAASVAGTALAVLAVAGAVPLLTPDRAAAPGPSDVATSAPSVAPSPASPYAFDPQQPWQYRGDRSVLGDGNLEEWRRAWALREPGAELVPLHGRVWEPSGLPEVVFVSVDPGREELLYGVATTSESGPRFLVAGDAPRASTSFAVVLEGDEGGQRLLVVAAPEVARLQYVADGEDPVELASLAPGVGTTPVVPVDAGLDAYVVTGQDGEEVERSGVPDQAARADGEAADPDDLTAAPDNVVGWEPRGALDPDLLLRARAAFAAAGPRLQDDVQEKVLASGRDGDRRYLLGQFWFAGETSATTFAVVVRGDDVEPQRYRPLTDDAAVVAMHLAPPGGTGGGTLVVVARPGIRQVAYSRAGDDRYDARTVDPAGTDVVLLQRDDAAERGDLQDRLRLRDEAGAVTATVAVRELLCGPASCG